MDREKKNLVVFGYGVAVILGLVTYRVWHHEGSFIIQLVLLSCAAALIYVTWWDYTLLKPFYKCWMAVAHLIGNVITGIILSILFYLVFGVAGLILRALKKDLLDRKLDRMFLGI